MNRLLLIVLLFLIPLALAWGSLPDIGFVQPPFSPATVYNSLVTPPGSWQLLRTVTASDTALTGITKAWTTVGAVGKFKALTAGTNGVRIHVYADGDGSGTGDPNGGSFSYKLFVADRYGGAQLVGTGTWAIGEEALSHNPTNGNVLTYGVTDPNSSKWGQLPVVSTNPWSGLSATGAANDIGELHCDVRASDAIWMEVTSLSNITHLYILVKSW